MLFRQRTAATGTWGPIDTPGSDQYLGLDLIVDNRDAPQSITGDSADTALLEITVNGVNIADIEGCIRHSGYPTIATDTSGTLVAVWEANREGISESRLFMATYHPADAVTKHYYAGGQRIATRVDGVLYYLHGDMLGSPVLVTDQTGAEVGRVSYDPWGQVISTPLPLTLTDRLFTGQIFDASTGLYYYNTRYYDPFVGQFTQPDSLVADPLNPAAWNRFAYVYNAPYFAT